MNKQPLSLGDPLCRWIMLHAVDHIGTVGRFGNRQREQHAGVSYTTVDHSKTQRAAGPQYTKCNYLAMNNNFEHYVTCQVLKYVHLTHTIIFSLDYKQLSCIHKHSLKMIHEIVYFALHASNWKLVILLSYTYY